MRCRKARSFLAAYCNDELVGRQQLAVREHLSACAACRREADIYVSIRNTGNELSGLKVSADFNTTLLNRIAQERFKETRTQAHMPRRAPVMSWRLVVPALVTTALVVFVAVGAFIPGQQDGVPSQAVVTSQDDSYLTVQPVSNPHITVNMTKDWSFDRQLAMAERFTRISRQLAGRSGFGNARHVSFSTRVTAGNSTPTPYGSFRVDAQPVYRVYETSTTVSHEEGERIY